MKVISKRLGVVLVVSMLVLGTSTATAAAETVLTWEANEANIDEEVIPDYIEAPVPVMKGNGLKLITFPAGDWEVVMVDGIAAVTTVKNVHGPFKCLCFQADDDLVFDLPELTEVIVEVEYLDAGGQFILQYDSYNPGMPVDGAYAHPEGGFLRIGRSGEWKTANWTLYDARFASRQNGKADFRIGTDDQFYFETTIRRIKITIKN